MARLAGLATALYLVPLAAQAQSPGELHFYNWTNYTAPAVIEKFQKETGIRVTLDTYDSNETLLAKLKAGGGGYDLVVMSSDFVEVFAKERLIQRIDAPSLPGYAQLDERWQSPIWDPGNAYTIPWVWGLTSFSVDTAVFQGPTDSLAALFEPPADMMGKVGMFGSPSEVISLGLVYLGKPQCNTAPDDLKAVQALLEKQKPFVKVYNSDGIIERQVTGETVLHEQWSGSAVRARLQKASIKFVFPKEGAVGWMDNLAVPTGAPNPENAKKFMAFMLQPENAALQSNFSGYQSAVKGYEPMLNAELANAPEFKVPEGLKVEFIPTCSQDAVRFYDRIWTRLRN